MFFERPIVTFGTKSLCLTKTTLTSLCPTLINTKAKKKACAAVLRRFLTLRHRLSLNLIKPVVPKWCAEALLREAQVYL